jgi:Zn-finger nucleic acid-binding protein
MVTVCPVCKDATLVDSPLEPELTAAQCTKCGGTYIAASSYDHWLSRSQVNQPETTDDRTISLDSGESSGPRFCPECKYVLTKYNVGKGIKFALNKCGHCGGTWLDKNEWEILKSRNLHDDIHLVFSDNWQLAVRAEEHKAAMAEIFAEHLGDDLEEISRIKNWLDNHANSDALYAYLLYSPDRSI